MDGFALIQAWVDIINYLQKRGDTSFWANMPMASFRLLDAWVARSATHAQWEPVPLEMPLTPLGELYCTAHVLNPHKVWLCMRTPTGDARILLPDHIRLHRAVAPDMPR